MMSMFARDNKTPSRVFGAFPGYFQGAFRAISGRFLGGEPVRPLSRAVVQVGRSGRCRFAPVNVLACQTRRSGRLHHRAHRLRDRRHERHGRCHGRTHFFELVTARSWWRRPSCSSPWHGAEKPKAASDGPTPSDLPSPSHVMACHVMSCHRLRFMCANRCSRPSSSIPCHEVRARKRPVISLVLATPATREILGVGVVHPVPSRPWTRHCSSSNGWI